MRIVLSMLLVCASLANAATYYVRKDGNNGNAGTADTSGRAWLTVAYAESRMAAGDTVYIRAGTYEEAPTVDLNGNSGAWINFVGESGTILRGLYVSGASYIRIIGIEFTQVNSTFNYNGSDSSAIVQIGTCTHIQWIDNYIHDTWGGDGVAAIHSSGTPTFITMRGNTIYWMNKGSGHANCTAINTPYAAAHHWVVEYNTIQRSLDYISLYGTNHVVRNNVLMDHNDAYWPTTPGTYHSDFFQPGSDGADVGSKFHMYEANFLGDNQCLGGSQNSPNGHGWLYQDTVASGDTNVLIRGCVVFHINNGAIGVVGLDKMMLYHNSFYDLNCPNTSDSPFIFFGAPSINNLLQNSIISGVGVAADAIFVDTGSSLTHQFNIGYNAGSESGYVSTSDPKYVSPASPTRNFRLQPDSPAIDAGASVTTITSGNGSGMVFDVADGLRLFDGWGLVEGDVITTGGTTTRITSISGNTVAVAASVTWTNLQPVYWGTDTSPDIGALPYGSTALTAATYSRVGNTYTVTPVGDARGVWFYVDGIPATWDVDAPYQATIARGTVTAKAYALWAQTNPVVSAIPCGPRFVFRPQSQLIQEGGTVEFLSLAQGEEPVRYQWIGRGIRIVGATNASLTVSNVSAANVGLYSVAAINRHGTKRATARLSMLPRVRIVTQPRPRTARAGATTTFRVRATGGKPLRFQWLRNETPIPGATNAVLRVENVAAADAGSYRVSVSNTFSAAESDNATLAVTVAAVAEASAEKFAGGIVTVPVLTPIALENGRFRIVVNGKSGGTIELQESSNLVIWRTIATQTNFSGVLEFMEPTTPGTTGRFFRAVRRE